MAELHLHGGRAVIAAVLAALAALPGLAPAEPGAFTRRALANGRIGLSEVEGLADLLAAETEGQRRQALRLAEGGLGRLIDGWRARLLMLAAGIEAAIDYGEDEAEVPEDMDLLATGLQELVSEIGAALDSPPAERLRDGIKVVIAGPPNIGKSTLINALAGRDVAIVADVAGTTRDLIEAPVIIADLPIVLIDSAGLRDADDPIEQLGTARTAAAMRSADLVVWLANVDDRDCPDTAIVVHARADLVEHRIEATGNTISLSAHTGEGLDRLRRAIVERARALLPVEANIALHQRHRALLQQVVAELHLALIARDPILRAENIRHCLALFDRVVGRTGVEDMLDALFGRFCVGK